MASDPDVYRAIPAYGYSDAVDAVGSTAAPLLAGFAFALIGLVVGEDAPIRWRDPTLALLVVAALLLIFTVQFAFTARRYYLSPDEFRQRQDLLPEQTLAGKRAEYVRFLGRHARWLSATRIAYNVGIATLLLGVAGILVPAGPAADIDPWRWVAIAAALAGFAIEVVWVLGGEIRYAVHRARFEAAAGSDRGQTGGEWP